MAILGWHYDIVFEPEKVPYFRFTTKSKPILSYLNDIHQTPLVTNMCRNSNLEFKKPFTSNGAIWKKWGLDNGITTESWSQKDDRISFRVYLPTISIAEEQEKREALCLTTAKNVFIVVTLLNISHNPIVIKSTRSKKPLQLWDIDELNYGYGHEMSHIEAHFYTPFLHWVFTDMSDDQLQKVRLVTNIIWKHLDGYFDSDIEELCHIDMDRDLQSIHFNVPGNTAGLDSRVDGNRHSLRLQGHNLDNPTQQLTILAALGYLTKLFYKQYQTTA